MYLGARKRKLFKIISPGIIYALIFSLVCPPQAWAARSSAGGGKIAKPDWGKVATNVGITVGTAVIGSALSSSFNSAWQTANPATNPAITQGAQSTDLFTKFGNFITDIPANIGKTINATGEFITNPGIHLSAGFGSMSSLSQVAPIIIKGYSVYAAGTQVARAVGMAGSYYGWSPKTTFIISSMGVGATGGFLNPAAPLGETLSVTTPIGSAMMKGMFVGGLSGWAQGAVIGAIDGDKLNKGKSPGVGAQVAGVAAGIYATELGKTLVNPRTYDTVWAEHTKKEEYNFAGAEPKNYVLDEEAGGYRYNEGKGQYDVLRPEELQKLGETPGIKVKYIAAGEKVEVTIGKPEINFVSAGTSSYTEDRLREKTGLPQFEKNLQAAKLWPENRDLSVSGGIAAMQGPEARPSYLDGISAEQLNFASKVKPGLTPGGLSLPVAGQLPSSSQVVGRILLAPLVRTLDHWPLIVTRALSLNATKGDSKWNPLLSEAIYATAAPLLDNFATIYNLKLGLATNIDEKLGYYPALKYQREQLFGQALVQGSFAAGLPKPPDILKPIEKDGTVIGYQNPLTKEILSCEEIAALKESYPDLVYEKNGQLQLYRPSTQDNKMSVVLVPSANGDKLVGYGADGKVSPQKFTMVGVNALEKLGVKVERQEGMIILPELGAPNVTPPAVSGKFTLDGNSRLWTALKGARDVYDRNNMPFTETEQVRVLTSTMVDIFRARGGSNEEIYKNAGWSNWDAFSPTIKNVFFSELPIALISGSIQVAMNDYLDDKSPSKAMWASLGAVAATSIARGIVWHNYGVDTYSRQIGGIVNHDDNPLEVFSYMPQSEADIISARSRGYLPLVDNRRFSAEKEYWYRDKKQELSDIQEKVNEVSRVYGIPGEEADLSRVDVDLGSIRKRINNKIKSQGVIDGVNSETLEYLDNIEQKVMRLKLDDKGSYQLGAGVDINPVPDKEGFYSLVLKPYQKPALEPDSVVVFGTRDVKDGYIIKTPQEAQARLLVRFVIDNGEILPKGEYKFPGAWGPYNVIKPAELMPTIVGSLGQGLFEFGWQSLAMGLPYTYQGKMGSYAWVNYLDTLKQLTSAAANGGPFKVMNEYATSTGVAQSFGVSKNLVERNILTTIADTGLGKRLGMAPFIPVSGYKGMPFSVAANIETGYRTVETRYYPYWPYQRMNVVPNDPFWRNIKAGMIYKTSGETYISNSTNSK